MIMGEILRNLLLASVIVWLLAQREPIKLKSVLVFAIILWLGFPVTLLSGSVMWQNVPLELALVHSGDWLIKILLMTVIPWVLSRNAELPSALLRPEANKGSHALSDGRRSLRSSASLLRSYQLRPSPSS